MLDTGCWYTFYFLHFFFTSFFIISNYLFLITFFALRMKTLHKTYLLLGSNLQDPKQQLKQAVKTIGKKVGKVMRSSALYETAAWGKTNQPNFLNQVLVLETSLDPFALMNTILEIELEMGRVRNRKYDARIIDIDILFYGKEIIKAEQLIIPHPMMSERRFVLTPLNELAPRFNHPVYKISIHQMLEECRDKLAVKKLLR